MLRDLHKLVRRDRGDVIIFPGHPIFGPMTVALRLYVGDPPVPWSPYYEGPGHDPLPYELKAVLQFFDRAYPPPPHLLETLPYRGRPYSLQCAKAAYTLFELVVWVGDTPCLFYVAQASTQQGLWDMAIWSPSMYVDPLLTRYDTQSFFSVLSDARYPKFRQGDLAIRHAMVRDIYLHAPRSCDELGLTAMYYAPETYLEKI